MNKRYRQQRKGIILLIIISILTMFMLIGVTYVVVSGHFQQSAVINVQAVQLGTPPQKQLDSAMYQIVRDTNHAGSALRGHSLFEDKYGHRGIHAVIVNATHAPDPNDPDKDIYPANGAILELNIYIHDIYENAPRYVPFDPTEHITLDTNSDLTDRGLSILSLGALNGRVMTFFGSVAKNTSVRILKSNPNIMPAGQDSPYNFTIRILFPNTISSYIDADTFIGQHIYVNGRDFSGTGGGLKPSPVALDTQTQMSLNALMPIRSADYESDFEAYRQGGLNEGYDIPDHQNMLLAGLINSSSDRKLKYVIPSLHRPALFNYWIHHRDDFVNSTLTSNPLEYNAALARTLKRILARPFPWENPNFTGGNELLTIWEVLRDTGSTTGRPMPGITGFDDDGNGIIDFFDLNGDGVWQPGYEPIDYAELFYVDNRATTPRILDNHKAFRPDKNVFPWDIDNDGDGIPDSIWVDLGSPIQTDSSGRQYKAMFAILCTDLDGRLNLNAHGNQSQYLASHLRDGNGNLLIQPRNRGMVVAGSLNTSLFPRGVGYGPSEINLLGSLLPNSQQGIQDYRNLLNGSNFRNGRYLNQFVGKQFPPRDPEDHPPFNGYPNNYISNRYSYFQSTTDIHGELARGINTAGNLVSEVAQSSPNSGPRDTITENPYETNLVFPDGSDEPFRPEELEMLLRFHDPDQPFYLDPGQDNQWGIATIDDDGNGIIDDVSEALAPGSDDFVSRANGNSRLFELTEAFTTGSDVQAAANRRSVTHASFDPPIPSVQIPRHLRKNANISDGAHAAQLLRARILQEMGGYNAALIGKTPVQLEYELNQLMQKRTPGPDGQIGTNDDVVTPLIDIKVFDGLKMDINRPFGNGLDDNNDGVVDNYSEVFLDLDGDREFDDLSGDGVIDSRDMRDWEPWHAFPGWPNVFFDRDNDGISGPDDVEVDADLARFNFARQLYTLALIFNERDGGNQLSYPTLAGDLTEDMAEDEFGDLEFQFHWAQWAINVVDFRDPDSSMTAFEFDINPFNGWDVDGRIGTTQQPSPDDNHPDRRVVWGCERPELLISESIVFHDRRTEDLDNEQPEPAGAPAAQLGQMGEMDYDQRLLPRSGAFFELYNPWFNPTSDTNSPASGSWHPREFYTNDGQLQLNKRSLHKNENGWYSPVFRMIVVQGDGGDDPDQYKDPDAYRNQHKPSNNQIQRAIYFTNSKELDQNSKIEIPTGAGHGKEQFFTSLSTNGLRGGQYAIIGSSGYHSGQINGRTYYDTFIGRSEQALGGQGPGQAGQDALKYDATRRIRLIPNHPSIQARLLNNGISDQFHGDNVILDSNGIEVPRTNVPVIGLPINYRQGNGGVKRKSLTLTEPIGGYNLPQAAVNGNDGGELELNPPADLPLDSQADDRLMTNGTIPKYAMVHLQRLADPLRAFHPKTNPYLTMDSSSIDVIAFNGLGDDSNCRFTTKRPYHLDDSVGVTDPYVVSSRQRGDQIANNIVWKYEPNTNNIRPEQQPLPPVANIPRVLQGAQHFKYDLKATLGFLNSGYGLPRTDGTPNDGKPFPILLWNNRPFISNLEMMQVPFSRSSRLLHDFDIKDQNINDPYDPGSKRIAGQFPHLMNFFKFGDNHGNWYHLLEYTETPSQFDGAYQYLHPKDFNQANYGTDELYAPFNKVSNYRDPGRINLNTIFDPNVFIGLMNGHGAQRTNYLSWIKSRQGFDGNFRDIISFDNNVPTLFNNPLRPAASVDMVPLRTMVPSRNGGIGDVERGVDLTLLRSTDDPAKPIWMEDDYSDNARNVSRNAPFNYQSLQRMGNLVTSRSNVYSIWMTVGYFEVKAVPPSTYYPDGYELGLEVGAERGQTTRHRAFYIIDRSIPTAFEPGRNHNTDKAVLLRRYLE